MAFKEEHPKHKQYKTPSNLHFAEVPNNSTWTELESLIAEAGGQDRVYLPKIVQMIATKVRAGNVDAGFAYQWIPDIVSKLRQKVNEGKFYLFMDCLAILCDDGELGIDELNEFLDDSKIGYHAVSRGWPHGVAWEKIEDEDRDDTIDNDLDISENPLLILPNDSKLIKSEEEFEKLKENQKKTTKIFITHSSTDKEYVLLLTELLRNLKVPNASIICTSDPHHKIPNGESTYSWLRRQFLDSDLHMIFVLSENYYRSTPCLNEMGAAWLTAKKSDLLLLPGFGFNDLKEKDGCLDKDIQGGNIDSDDRMLKAWLQNLRDDIVKEFNLEKPNDLDWEEYRDSFINNMRSVTPKQATNNKVQDEDEYDFGEEKEDPVIQAIIDAGGISDLEGISNQTGISFNSVKRKLKIAIDAGIVEVVDARKPKKYKIRRNSDSLPDQIVVEKNDVGNIPVDSAFLLVYAANDNGQIMRIQTLGSPIQVSAAGKQFMADNSNRESARWVEALDRLISWGWVKPVGHKGEIFELTGTGYQKADWLKDGMRINTENEPLEEIQGFGG